jgi:hypothetical protein
LSNAKSNDGVEQQAEAVKIYFSFLEMMAALDDARSGTGLPTSADILTIAPDHVPAHIGTSGIDNLNLWMICTCGAATRLNLVGFPFPRI